jgi:hypothetical protein
MGCSLSRVLIGGTMLGGLDLVFNNRVIVSAIAEMSCGLSKTAFAPARRPRLRSERVDRGFV